MQATPYPLRSKKAYMVCTNWGRFLGPAARSPPSPCAALSSQLLRGRRRRDTDLVADIEPHSVNCLVRPGPCGYLGEQSKPAATGQPLATGQPSATGQPLPMWHVLGRTPDRPVAADPPAAGYPALARLSKPSSPVQISQLSRFDPFSCLPMQSNNRRHTELFHFRKLAMPGFRFLSPERALLTNGLQTMTITAWWSPPPIRKSTSCDAAP